MTDPDLFNYVPPPSEQQRQIERVTSAIGLTVMEFCRLVGVGGTFHAQELRAFMDKQTAPGSPDRILRDLRGRGVLDYVVESRTKSLYRVTSLQPRQH